MKILIEYEMPCSSEVQKLGDWKKVKVSEERVIPGDNYTKIIGEIYREFHDKGLQMPLVRCLDPHPNDVKKNNI